MTARRLTTRRVEKPWGRHQLSPWFPDVAPDDPAVGEIWFEAPGDPELLVKYLFTSERLSIQVHPDDAAARAAGFPRGKDEAWLVLAAGEGAQIGIGTTRPLGAEALRAAAIDGSIETLIDWRRVKAGDVFYSPAGTVHALGPELVVVEIQQNVDLTYRLYDYGRPRALHLEEAVAAARAVPFTGEAVPEPLGAGRTRIVDGPAFSVERWQGAGEARTEPALAWLTVLAGGAEIDRAHAPAHAGETWVVEAGTGVRLAEGADVLVSYPRARPLA